MPLRHLAVLALSLVAGCGTTTVYQPGRGVAIDVQAPRDVDEAEIARAFASRSQMGESSRVAFYALDPRQREDFGQLVGRLPGVVGGYAIPTVLVTGQRRFDDEPPVWERRAATPLNVKQLRLLAARAHCELLVVFDYGSRIRTRVNGWAALGVLVLPLLFTPHLDSESESYLEAYVIDTRNGYLYAHVSSQEQGQDRRQTVYSRRGEERVERQRRELLRRVGGELARVLGCERGGCALSLRAEAATSDLAPPDPRPASAAAR